MKLIIYFIFYLLVPIFVVGAQEKIDLFIWAGQSNAQGWTGNANEYPIDSLALDSSILLNWTFFEEESSNGKWVKMQPQKGRYPKGHFGPEVSFSRDLKKAGYNPAIFKYTRGATGLARDWKSPGQGGIYDHMVTDLKKAIKDLKDKGNSITIRGFIWIQGESDGDSNDNANAYKANLRRLIEDLRSEVVKNPKLKVILGVDEQHGFMVERPQVVEAQKSIAESDENITFSSMYALPKADATHLTTKGLIEHGHRLFNAYQLLSLGKQETPHHAGKLKVLTYNIWNGFDWSKDNIRRAKLQHWVNLKQPEVVALQELLCNYTPEKLKEDAKSWGHAYSVLLKTTGYSVGLTSRYPIRLKEKILEGMHHGALHCSILDIDFIVVHLHPGSINKRREESKVLLDKIERIKSNNEKYIVLGDFNAHSPFDAIFYEPEGDLLNRLKQNNINKGLNGNIDINGDLDYSVLSSFLSIPMYDVVKNYTQDLDERGSFPGRVLGVINNETEAQLLSRLERIDYILVSPELAVKTVDAKVCNGVENWYLSDHYPVLVQFE
ncbi:sialate O-acetylesterase [Aestuariibaculum sediminum]|uniref:Endonuclease/exonuclease/phosphatase family protein n=1 Tax=Aestuariibaculum sediminum TaxID=2770637 RepID=A0A8J6QH26_9FLAO|nr:sialate O-acetylesterase [Aestuariibaculum sediminum]MBD0831624.1 endonuclease/exonuclease/phosphatase family protein [Aestuariibaculum sediminum]